MQVIETTAHVSPDGMLRLELQAGQPNQEVQVAVVVEPIPPQAPNSPQPDDRWASVREKFVAAGFRVPAPGLNNIAPIRPIELPGISASELLIGDRR